RTNAGIYYVWYKVVADSAHRDTEPACIPVTIAEAKGSSAGNLPQTGDLQNPLLYAVIALISVAGIGLFRKRME
ncbi:MAG: LPXTG cell wall anchor domain-containing protein, partial [Clostridia bacterium]|nr:LPXTG cell wall anchor domain-containing protein [Clostridia bacterium]